MIPCLFRSRSSFWSFSFRMSAFRCRGLAIFLFLLLFAGPSMYSSSRFCNLHDVSSLFTLFFCDCVMLSSGLDCRLCCRARIVYLGRMTSWIALILDPSRSETSLSIRHPQSLNHLWSLASTHSRRSKATILDPLSSTAVRRGHVVYIVDQLKHVPSI